MTVGLLLGKMITCFFIIRGNFIYISRVAFKYPFTPNETEQLNIANFVAEKVWGKDVDGRTWPYLIFLKDVKK